MKNSAIFSLPVVVAALGYFVDIYDLVLFGIFRIPSLKEIGLSGKELEDVGSLLLNVQMIGMLIGGFFWGILGDKKGRLSVLFGSILVYSIANILNAYVVNETQYILLRFFAGFGLAGELGAGITLVSEILKKEDRGWGTTFVATVGVSGAVFAGWFGNLCDGDTYLMGYQLTWKTGYIIGGVLGFMLLLLRVGVFESGMFHKAKEENIIMGSLSTLFNNKERIKRYFYCILAGLPIWYGVGILVFFSPELGKEMGVVGEIKPSLAVMFAYTGVTLGDLSSGLLSQLFRSRIKIIITFIALTALAVASYPFLAGASVAWLYFVCFLIGTFSGYWAVIITTSAEQFGTNIRATVATTVPNFIRASLVPVSFIYGTVMHKWIGLDKVPSAMYTGVIVFAVALFAASRLKETFGKDLNYYERD
jgi:MFS transporter, putative metabolite:H+ symporter